MLPPTPTALKILRGNPGKRPLNKNEPEPGEFNAEPPDTLNEDGRAEWERLVPILKGMRVLTDADYGVLRDLCWLFQTVVMAQRQFAQAGLLYKTQSGYIQPSPLHGIIQRGMAEIIKRERELGLTPSSRSKISVGKPTTNNKWDKLG